MSLMARRSRYGDLVKLMSSGGFKTVCPIDPDRSPRDIRNIALFTDVDNEPNHWLSNDFYASLRYRDCAPGSEL